jgi:hypothetical protein
VAGRMLPVSKVLTGYTNEGVGRAVPVLITLLSDVFTVVTFQVVICMIFTVRALRPLRRASPSPSCRLGTQTIRNISAM